MCRCEFILINRYLPFTQQTQNGKWHYTIKWLPTDVEISKKAIGIFTDMAMKVNAIIS